MTFIREHLTRALKGGSRRISFKETVPDRKDKYDIAVSFVSVLQMMLAREGLTDDGLRSADRKTKG